MPHGSAGLVTLCTEGPELTEGRELTGDVNTGDVNTGDVNSLRDVNTGDGNTGDGNTGDGNTRDRRAGPDSPV